MIGVAISTHKRPAVLARALTGWASFMPDVLVVNHDRAGAGVAHTKNAGIAALMDAGCDQLFLADDDVWPITPDWALPYVLHDQPHLIHCWGKSRFIAEDETTTVWNWPRGVLLYAERHVIDRVGGMRLEFGRWGGEHAEWSRRIHNTGLTKHPFQDAAQAKHGVWHCEDYTRNTPSSVPANVRDSEANRAHRHRLYNTHRHSIDYVPFR